MKLLTMPAGRPQCIIYATAMLLNVTPEEVIDKLSHDGMAVWWPEYRDYARYRGHHIDEIVDLMVSYGRTLTPINRRPVQGPIPIAARPYLTETEADSRFNDYFEHTVGLLINSTHACAYTHGIIYDPRGMINKSWRDYNPIQLWMMGYGFNI